MTDADKLRLFDELEKSGVADWHNYWTAYANFEVRGDRGDPMPENTPEPKGQADEHTE